jgi:hypothetical protein
VATTPNPAPVAQPGKVVGRVTAGPVCPVERIPPDPACAPRAVQGAHIKITRAGAVVGEVTSNQSGYFSVALPPGAYTLVPQPVQGLMGTAGPVDVNVGNAPVEVEISYDTGIR